MNEKYFESKNPISKEESLEHGSLSLLRNFTAGIPVLMDWVKGGVKKEPLEIFDINGTLLFYDFTVRKGNNILGTMRTSASKILGSPVFAYEISPRSWDFESSLKIITVKVRKEFPAFKISSTKLVCYSYPKLGIMFETENDPKKKNRLIFDIADFSLIPIGNEKGGIEGLFAWSFYDSLSEDVRKNRLSRYEQTDKWRREIPAGLRKELISSATLAKFIDFKEFICKFKINVTKQLQFCTHYNYNESRSHHCFSLHAQQVKDYCAVATCQMVLCYYRYYYSQADIAPALGYSPGGCPSDQSAGYEHLSNNHIDATFDSTPTWEEARNQIDALHPFKSGISGHARACAGYSHVWWLCDGIKDKKLYIYDPWPWNADYKLGGSVYWEDWDAITHTNYVFTRLLYP